MPETSKKVLEAMDEIKEKYGDLTIMKIDAKHDFKIESYPTGSTELDYVFGCGGLPKGRIIEIHGMQSSGKSSLSMYLAGQIQRAGGVCLWIDAECCFDRPYAESLGINIKDLIISQPDYGEQAFDIIEKMIKVGVDLIVVDSVAALLPKKELEGTMDENEQMAGRAKLLARGLRRLTTPLAKSKTTIIFINQLIDNITKFGFGPSKITPGGNALRFYSSIRLEVSKIKTLKNSKEEATGITVKLYGVKNKCAQPLRVSEVDFMFGKGFVFNQPVKEKKVKEPKD